MSDSHGHDDEHGLAHAMPISTLLLVFGALVALTFLTVFASYFLKATPALRFLGVPTAMFIATVKALLVCLFFMHLLYDKALNNIIFFFCLAFFFLFMAFTVIDTLQYQSNIEDYSIGNPPAPAAAPAAP